MVTQRKKKKAKATFHENKRKHLIVYTMLVTIPISLHENEMLEG